MGHLNEVKKEYKALRARLDKYPVGAPESEHLYSILRMLFTEDQAAMASKMPIIPSSLSKLSKKTGVKKSRLENMLDEMADKGLVMDIRNPKTDEVYYVLAPTVVGFFEFVMMRARDDIPQKEIAEAMYHYMYDNSDFANEVFQQKTQIGRAIVHETAVKEDDLSRILDWERATHLIEQVDTHSLSLCYCRHKARHTGHACGRPEEICMSLGDGAKWLTSRNLARKSSKEELLDLLEVARSEGLVHITDNVQQQPGFLCNCCGCCCGMLSAINKHGITNAVHTTGFIASIDLDTCKGCGKCAKLCPIGAINIKEKVADNGRKKKWAVVDESICLGCGVCERACSKFKALSMKERRNRKILTPETTLDRILTMAVERDKLHNIIFDEMENPNLDFLKNLVGNILKLPASKRLLLNNEIKSKFLDFVQKQASI